MISCSVKKANLKGFAFPVIIAPKFYFCQFKAQIFTFRQTYSFLIRYINKVKVHFGVTRRENLNEKQNFCF